MEDILNINKFAMLAPLLLEGNLSHLELGVFLGLAGTWCPLYHAI